MKLKLEIGDTIQRFENNLNREVGGVYIIESVTKTLAKSGVKVFRRDLDYGTKHPENSSKEVVARVYTKEKQTWSSPDYFLVKS